MSPQQQRGPDSEDLAQTLLLLTRELGYGQSRLERALEQITEAAARALSVDRCSVWRIDDERGLLVCLDLYRADQRKHEHHLGLSIGEYQAYFQALRDARFIDADDALHDPRTREFAKTYLIPSGIRSMLDAPIRRRGAVMGVICLEQTSLQRQWTAEECSFAASLSDILATVFESADHEKLQRHFLQSQKLEAVGRLAGGVAHDFNNLLTAIRGNVDLVQDVLLAHPVAGREVRSEMEHIVQAIDRAAALTRQLLAFGGRQNRGNEVFDANLVVAAMQSMLARLLPESIFVDFALDDRESKICADPTLIEQIMLNLVLNARDALKNGGCLKVRSSQTTVNERTHWLLEIEDEGVGISPDIHQLICEPFFTTKEEGKGSGLGLSTVLGIVKSLGGRLNFESEMGRGSTFAVEIPLAG